MSEIMYAKFIDDDVMRYGYAMPQKTNIEPFT